MSPSPKKTKTKSDGKQTKLKKYSVTQKLEIIDMRDNGAKWIKIAQEKGISESTVRGIYANRDEIRVRGECLDNYVHFQYKFLANQQFPGIFNF